MKLGLLAGCLNPREAEHYQERIWEASGGEGSITLVCATREAPNHRIGRPRCIHPGMVRVETPDQVISKCDGLIVFPSEDEQENRALCEVSLQSGKPTYIRGFFTPSGETAESYFAMAEKSGTPCWAASPLRFARELENLPLADTVSSWGPGSFRSAGMDQLEPLFMLMRQMPERVMALKDEACERLSVAFEGGRFAGIACFAQGSPFQMNLGMGGKILTMQSDYFNAFIHQLVRFFRTAEVPVPRGDTLRTLHVMETGVRALACPGEWIAI